MIKLVIRLHYGVTSVQDVLKEKYFVSDKVLDVTKIYATNTKRSLGLTGAKIYIEKTTQRIPEWLGDINELVPKNKKINVVNTIEADKFGFGFNQSNRAVLVIKRGTRIFSVAFGYGDNMLREETIEPNFGLRVAANSVPIVNQSESRSIQVDERIMSLFSQSLGRATLANRFRENQLPMQVGGSGDDKVPFATVSGSDSLTLTQDKKISDLSTILDDVATIYDKETYRSNGNAWLDKVSTERHENIINKLDKEVVKRLLDVNDQSVTFSPNMVFDSSLMSLRIPGLGDSMDDTENSFKQHIKEKSVEEALKEWKNKKLYVVDSKNDNTNRTFLLRNATIAQVKLPGQSAEYVLLFGAWYKFDDSYVVELNRFLNTIHGLSDTSFKFPSYKSIKNSLILQRESDYEEFRDLLIKRGYSVSKKNKRGSKYALPYEYVYNKALAQNINRGQKRCDRASGQRQAGLVHPETISVENESGSIEPSDVVYYNHGELTMFFVKDSHSSSNLSHLFNQGFVVSELSRSRTSASWQKIEKLFQGKGILRLGSEINEVKFIFVLLNENGQNITSLPIFSKIALKMAVETMQRNRINVGIVFS